MVPSAPAALAAGFPMDLSGPVATIADAIHRLVPAAEKVLAAFHLCVVHFADHINDSVDCAASKKSSDHLFFLMGCCLLLLPFHADSHIRRWSAQTR